MSDRGGTCLELDRHAMVAFEDVCGAALCGWMVRVAFFDALVLCSPPPTPAPFPTVTHVHALPYGGLRFEEWRSSRTREVGPRDYEHAARRCEALADQAAQAERLGDLRKVCCPMPLSA